MGHFPKYPPISLTSIMLFFNYSLTQISFNKPLHTFLGYILGYLHAAATMFAAEVQNWY